MTSSRQERLLRDNHVATNGDQVLIMKPNALADPRTVPYYELPWELDPGSWAENDAFPNLCAKEAEYRNAQPRTNLPWI